MSRDLTVDTPQNTCVEADSSSNINVSGTSTDIDKVHVKIAATQTELDCKDPQGNPIPCPGAATDTPDSNGDWDLDMQPVNFVSGPDCEPLSSSKNYLRAWGEYIDGADTKYLVRDREFNAHINMPMP